MKEFITARELAEIMGVDENILQESLSTFKQLVKRNEDGIYFNRRELETAIADMLLLPDFSFRKYGEQLKNVKRFDTSSSTAMISIGDAAAMLATTPIKLRRALAHGNLKIAINMQSDDEEIFLWELWRIYEADFLPLCEKLLFLKYNFFLGKEPSIPKETKCRFWGCSLMLRKQFLEFLDKHTQIKYFYGISLVNIGLIPTISIDDKIYIPVNFEMHIIHEAMVQQFAKEKEWNKKPRKRKSE